MQQTNQAQSTNESKTKDEQQMLRQQRVELTFRCDLGHN